MEYFLSLSRYSSKKREQCSTATTPLGFGLSNCNLMILLLLLLLEVMDRVIPVTDRCMRARECYAGGKRKESNAKVK